MQLKQLEIVANLVSVAVTSFLQQSGGGNLPHDTESEARSSGRELEAKTRRKLQGDESPFAGLLSVLLGGGSPEGDGELFLGAMTDAAKDCDIDFNEMIGKAVMAMAMLGGVDETQDSLDTMLDNVMMALKDDDENTCGPVEEAKILVAIDSFVSCSGSEDFFFEMEKAAGAGSLDDTFMNDCKDSMNMATSLEFPGADLSGIGDLPPGMTDEQSNAVQTCMKTLTGDNLIGNLIRSQYQNIDTTLRCFHGLSKEIPKCVLSEPSGDGDGSIDLPMSLEKKLTCMLGEEILYKPMLESACIELHAGLEACLPPEDQQQNKRQYEKVQECAYEHSILLGEIPFVGIDATAITGKSIYPSFCARVAPSVDFSSLDDRITHYNGWVVDQPSDLSDESSESVEILPKLDKQEGRIADKRASIAVTLPNSEQVGSNPPEIAVSLDSEQESSTSSESAQGTSGISPTVIGVLVLGALLTMAAVFSRKRAANVSYAQPHDLRLREVEIA